MKNSTLRSVVLIIILLISALKTYEHSIAFDLVISQKCESEGVSQVFIDTGRGYNESESYRGLYKSDWQVLTFNIKPLRKVLNVRYDPIHVEAKCKITQITLLKQEKEYILNWDDLAQNNSANLFNDGANLVVEPNGADPSFEIKSEAINLQEPLIASLIYFVCYFGVASLLTIGFLAIGRYAVRKFELLEIGVLVQNLNFRKLAFISGVAVLLSNYPVVFFGKSYVSLYGTSSISDHGAWTGFNPTDVKFEDFRGSDTGATAWAIKPNSAVAFESVVNHHEFPFYNKYVAGGIPLYGQGNNLLGDPLNYIPFLFSDYALGWDIKVLISKWIFILFLGVFLSKFISNSTAVIVTMFSAAFVGYWTFRFNHPGMFNFTYASAVLCAWVMVADRLSVPDEKKRDLLIALSLLAIAVYLNINSGPMKEAIILALFINFYGICITWFKLRGYSIAVRTTVIGLITFGLICVNLPYLLTFLDTLKENYTNYDSPSVHQLNVGHLMSLFVQSFSPWLIVSSNLICLFSLSSSWHFRKSLNWLWIGQIFLILLASFFAYEIIPSQLLVRVPYLNNIQHLWNVFSIPILFFLLLLSGHGVSTYLGASKDDKLLIIKKFILIVICLSTLSFIMSEVGAKPLIPLTNDKYKIAAFVGVMALVGIFYLLEKCLIENKNGTNPGFALFIFVALATHGLHLPTNSLGIDRYLLNPLPRVKEVALPPSLVAMKRELDRTEARAIGLGSILFPGFHAQYSIQSIISVDPLRNKNFEELLDLVYTPFVRGWGWLRLVEQSDLKTIKTGLDVLNIKFIVTRKDVFLDSPFKLFSHDEYFNVWENPTVWPRAYFVDKAFSYRNKEEFKTILDQSTGPFVAVEFGAGEDVEGEAIGSSGYSNVDSYSATNNKLYLELYAPSSGIVAIHSSYYPDSFRVTVNGTSQRYFRINGAFIGIKVESAGKKKIELEYRPKNFYRYFYSIFIGMLLLCAVAYIKRKRHFNQMGAGSGRKILVPKEFFYDRKRNK